MIESAALRLGSAEENSPLAGAAAFMEMAAWEALNLEVKSNVCLQVQ